MFGSTGSWLWTLYSSAVFHLPLPGRGRARSISLQGYDAPFFIRLGTTDYSVLREIFVQGEYADVAGLHPASIRTIVDLGANVGYSARLWQGLFPHARVVAVEPDAGNMALCRLNLSEPAGLAPVLIQACAAAHPGRVDLDRTLGAWAYAMKQPSAGSASGEIDALTVDQILERAGVDAPIDLLKCDIEGAEQELFAAGGPWLDAVGTMVVELHGAYLPERFVADITRSGHEYETIVVEKSQTCHVVVARRTSE